VSGNNFPKIAFSTIFTLLCMSYVAQNETLSTRVLLSGTLKIQFGINQMCIVYIP
jgi:hypothetical protein